MSSSDPEASPAPTMEAQLVKGLTFLTARTHFISTFDEPTFERLIAPLSEDTRALFTDAVLAEMYPETHMQAFMHRVYDDLAGGDDEVFLEIVRDLAMAGVSKFFRILLGLASARFVVRKIPTVFQRLREGTAKLTVEELESTARIHYEGFPFCRDHVYRLLSMGNCQAIVYAAVKHVPDASVLEWGPDSMTLEFAVPAKSRRRESEPGASASGAYRRG